MDGRMRIAFELVRIAAELSPEEQIAEIDGMNIPQLLDVIRRNIKNYTSMSPSMKMVNLEGKADMSKPVKRMTIKELFRLLAKLGVGIK